MAFRVDDEPGGTFGLQRIAGENGILAYIHHRYLTLVFDVDIDLSVLIGDGGLGFAIEGDGGDDLAFDGVDHGKIVTAAVAGDDGLRIRLIHDRVGVLARSDLGENGAGFEIENGNVV